MYVCECVMPTVSSFLVSALHRLGVNRYVNRALCQCLGVSFAFWVSSPLSTGRLLALFTIPTTGPLSELYVMTPPPARYSDDSRIACHPTTKAVTST